MPETKIQVALSNLAVRNERILQPVLRKWFFFMKKQILRDLSSKFKKDITSELTDWEFIEEQGKRTIKPASLKIMQSGGNTAYRQLAIIGSFDILNVNAIKAADKFCAKLVVDVTAETKKGIRTFIRHGIKEGMSMPKIAKEIRPLVGLTDRQTDSIINFRRILEEKRPDLSAVQVDRRVGIQTNKVHRRRIENIARTETARAQNIGYIQGLGEVGVEEVELNAVAGACEICAAMDGNKYSVSEGANIIPVHPNCRCAMLPVINNKTITGELKKPPPELRDVKLPKPTLIIPKKPIPKPVVEPAEKLFEAENIGKAEANARRILGIDITDVKARANFSYKGIDVEAANHVNRALYNFKQKFPQMRLDAIEVGAKGKNVYAEARYHVPTGKSTLVLSKDDFKNYKVLSKKIKRDGATNYLVGDSVDDLIAHEMGHVLSYNYMGRMRDINRFNSSLKSLENVRFLQKGLSKYATQDGAEGLAEVFSKYVKTGGIEGISTTSKYLTTEKVLKIYAGVSL